MNFLVNPIYIKTIGLHLEEEGNMKQDSDFQKKEGCIWAALEVGAVIRVTNEHKERQGYRFLFCGIFIDYAKAFDCVDHNKLWKILRDMGIPGHMTCLLETYMQVRKRQLELDMEQQTGSK